jgi:large subunit ribosomal protein L15
MLTRKKKKNSKYLGGRTHGRGDVKRGRGKGNKGGIGNAGWNKHEWTRSAKNKKQRMKDKKGFDTPTNKSVKTINIFEINNMIEKNKIKDTYVFKGKILGSGKINFPIHIKALSFTEKAKQKIEAVGGKTELLKIEVKKPDVES